MDFGTRLYHQHVDELWLELVEELRVIQERTIDLGVNGTWLLHLDLQIPSVGQVFVICSPLC